MGESAGMVGVEGSLHHQLQIRQQALGRQTFKLRLHRRQHTQGWQGGSGFGLTEPRTEQAGRLMQKALQLGIEPDGSGEAAELGGPSESRCQGKPLNGGRAGQRGWTLWGAFCPLPPRLRLQGSHGAAPAR